MRLLLVEDDVMVASGIKLGLSDAGYSVDWVGSAERAEQALERESFDAAILDIGKDNLELVAAKAGQHVDQGVCLHHRASGCLGLMPRRLAGRVLQAV